MELSNWAEGHAGRLQRPLGRRWLHARTVADVAGELVQELTAEDAEVLIAAAYLHDIGYAHELAMVTVHGDGDTDLDLYVYDENGNCVASDTSLGDQCVVTWTPRWTGSFTIRVVNRGFLPNNYTIMAS